MRNELPAIADLNASGAAEVLAETIRNPDGAVAAGAVVFDVDYRFPDAAEFTGMHIHDQVAARSATWNSKWWRPEVS